MSRHVAILLEREDLIGSRLRWPLAIAADEDVDLHVLIGGGGEKEDGARTIDLFGESPLRAALDEHLGADGWTPAVTEEDGDDTASSSPLRVEARVITLSGLEPTLRELYAAQRIEMLVLVGASDRRKDWLPRFDAALEFVTSTACVVVASESEHDGTILVPTGRGVNDRVALGLGLGLGARAGRRVEAVSIQPNIGVDSAAVGRRTLDRRLDAVRGAAASVDISRRVIVRDDPEQAILDVAASPRVEVVVGGASRDGDIGVRRPKSGAGRVVRAEVDATLIVVRAPVPLGGRISRNARAFTQRHVPQLSRDDRIDLVERIQSNARWNFDFVALMALSTSIAALGLLDDSAAVIIGAMLVAPLMTPLLGLALALVQRNVRLAGMTAKAVALGFATAFGLALLIGLGAPQYHEPSPEMEARDWPQLLDLTIAFASGLAAAFATARPNLLAALPGVAIAAALVPPIVTAGLAAAVGDSHLAIGAVLLFGVNMLAIVVAAALVLWSVGVPSRRAETPRLVLVGRAFSIVTFLAAAAMVVSPPRLQASPALIGAIEEALGDDYRLRRIRLRPRFGDDAVQVDLGGRRTPSDALEAELLRVAREQLGTDAHVRLTFRFEILLD